MFQASGACFEYFSMEWMMCLSSQQGRKRRVGNSKGSAPNRPQQRGPSVVLTAIIGTRGGRCQAVEGEWGEATGSSKGFCMAKPGGGNRFNRPEPMRPCASTGSGPLAHSVGTLEAVSLSITLPLLSLPTKHPLYQAEGKTPELLWDTRGSSSSTPF